MYILQEEPDQSYTLENGVTDKPIATLKDEHGGVSHITSDDGCIVLVQKHIVVGDEDDRHNEGDEVFCWATHWYPEALQALRKLMNDGTINAFGPEEFFPWWKRWQWTYPMVMMAALALLALARSKC